ncbi:MAG: MFS transporter [Amnibacterium sp.]
MTTATTSPPTAPAAPRNARAILLIVLVGYFMVILDNSVVFTGVPSIQRDLHLDAAGLSWVQDAYTLTFGGFLLLAARAGDLLGRRRLFIAGLVLFTLASALVGAAQSDWWIVTARAVQGVGAAIVAPTSLALLTATFEAGKARARAVALYAAVAGIGASVGLVLGGALTQWVSWRAGFLVNLPIGVAMILLGLKAIPPLATAPGRFDALGAVLATAGVGAVTFGVVGSSTVGWASVRTVGSIGLGIVVLALLLAHEARADQPILPLQLFADRARAGAYAVRFLYLAAMIGFFFFTTQLLQATLGFSPLMAGLGFLPMTAVNFAVAMQVARVLRLLGPGGTLLAGVLLTFAGMIWLASAGANAGYLLGIGLPMVLIGAGQGLAFAPLTSLAIRGVHPAEAGAASGILNTVHQLGSCLGLAALTTAAASTTATSAAFCIALTGSSIMLAAALLIAALILSATRTTTERTAR